MEKSSVPAAAAAAAAAAAHACSAVQNNKKRMSAGPKAQLSSLRPRFQPPSPIPYYAA